MPRRRDLRPAPEVSDAVLLASAARSATRARNVAERRRRADLADVEAARAERELARPVKGRPQADPAGTPQAPLRGR